MSPKILVITLSLAAFATSAQANTNQQTAPATTAAAPAKAEKKYCMKVAPMTGSRLGSTECKTKKDWARDGVEVDKATKA